MELKCVKEELSYVWCIADKANYDPFSSATAAVALSTWRTGMLPSVLMLSTRKEQVPSREKAVRDRSTMLLSRA